MSVRSKRKCKVHVQCVHVDWRVLLLDTLACYVSKYIQPKSREREVMDCKRGGPQELLGPTIFSLPPFLHIVLNASLLKKQARFKCKAVSKDILPIGTLIKVIGDIYPGKRATNLGHTSKMYNMRLEVGKVTVIWQDNGSPISSHPTTDWCSTKVTSSR